MNFIVCISSFLLAVPAIEDSSYNKVLQFPREASFSHYVTLKPDFSEVEKEISVCSWVKFYRTDSQRVWFSYATATNFNTLFFSSNPAAQAAFLGKELPNTNVKFTPYLWQHQCFIWDTVSEHAELFLDGKRVGEGITPTGSKLPAGGTLVLGLEQDCLGGCWEKGEEYGGEIYGLQILKRRLTPAEIKDMYEAGICDKPTSNPDEVITWKDFLDAERHGNVKEISGGCSVWDRLNDFVGEVISPALIIYLEGGKQEEDEEEGTPKKKKKKKSGSKKPGSITDWGKILENFINQKISRELISHLKRHHKF